MNASVLIEEREHPFSSLTLRAPFALLGILSLDRSSCFLALPSLWRAVLTCVRNVWRVLRAGL
jgi:hypothetical protein